MESLLVLQEKDRQVMDIEAEIEALEPRVAALDQELQAVEDALAAAERHMIEVTERRGTLEGKIESYRVMQERRRQKLEWVRGAKEASTIMAEIDLARSVLAQEEAEWIRSADAVQQVELTVEEARARVEEVREGQAESRAAIEAEQNAAGKRLKQAIAAREAQVAEVKQPLLVKYDRVRRGRAPLALYALQRGACGHCHTAVPLHLQQQLQRRGASSTCEACGVMLYLDGA